MNWLLVNAILCVLFLGPWPVCPALGYGDDSNGIELFFEAFLINRLQEPAAHFSINFENGPAYGVRFFGIE